MAKHAIVFGAEGSLSIMAKTASLCPMHVHLSHGGGFIMVPLQDLKLLAMADSAIGLCVVYVG